MFVFGKPAVKSTMEHKHELAIKRINYNDNDNVDTFHKLWMPIVLVEVREDKRFPIPRQT